MALDLKTPEAVEACLKLMDGADAIIEGFRPGVMERLGLGPDVALKRNPKLVFGRMTGWGQTGPYAMAAGHDMNYIAITGALHAIGTTEKPVPPLNLVGDFGGGALYLAFGLLAGVIQARETGKGQVIDCAMSDGAASLMAMFYGFKAAGMWKEERRSNMLDGGAHFYDTYQCSDGKWVSIGSIEPQFYALLLEKTGIDDAAFQKQHDRSAWPELREAGAVIAQKTRAEWTEIMGGRTSASPRCWTWRRRRSTRTTSHAKRSWRSAAWCSPRPRPAFRSLPARSRLRRRPSVRMIVKRSVIGASRKARSQRFRALARSPNLNRNNGLSDGLPEGAVQARFSRPGAG